MPSSQLQPISWNQGELILLDQRKLPKEKTFLHLRTLEETIFAIQEMAVRGAPAIAITGVFALALGVSGKSGEVDRLELAELIRRVFESRPTAVNLSLALNEVKRITSELGQWSEIAKAIEALAIKLMANDLRDNQILGKNGLTLFDLNQKEFHIITHCNTGALATAGHGTALGVIRSLRDAGKKVIVYADETRPFLQGSRLTAFEMQEEGIECYVITDGMSGWLMSSRKIDAVIVGCDRVAMNGDTANKIGTYNLAIVAKAHGVPVFVCATRDSFDQNLSTGSLIPIEMRREEEVTRFDFIKGKDGSPYLEEGTTSPIGARALNPSFDVTPNSYISSFVTEFGCFSPSEIESRLKK